MNSPSTTLSPARRPFDFSANHLVLDFVNTVNGRPVFTRDDLTSPADVVEWMAAAGLVNHAVPGAGEPLEWSASGNSGFAGAIALRESLYEVFGPIAAGDEPHERALAALTRRAGQAMRTSQWERRGNGFAPHWPGDSVESLCDRLADDAVQLLRSPLIARVGSCAGCGWLFLDVSRAHARRWCSMDACGVRDKMRRYHQRQVSRLG